MRLRLGDADGAARDDFLRTGSSSPKAGFRFMIRLR